MGRALDIGPMHVDDLGVAGDQDVPMPVTVFDNGGVLDGRQAFPRSILEFIRETNNFKTCGRQCLIGVEAVERIIKKQNEFVTPL